MLNGELLIIILEAPAITERGYLSMCIHSAVATPVLVAQRVVISALLCLGGITFFFGRCTRPITGWLVGLSGQEVIMTTGRLVIMRKT